VLVPEEALGTDQGQKFVYVVEDGKTETGEPVQKVGYRQVRPGQQFGRLRVVEDGVKAGDRVIVSGLQRVRPGAVVTAKPAEPQKPDTTPRQDRPTADTAAK
jgi:multidrug efflux pump subunit AcrA (membrane-fusion protein)